MSQGNKSEDCFFSDVDELMKSVQLVVYVFIFFLGLFFNVLVIRGFCIFLQKRCLDYVVIFIYMINLAVFDLLLVFFLLFKTVLNYVSIFFFFFCILAECFYFISMYGSVFTICFISLDRFLVIQYFIQVSYFRFFRKIFGICFVIWVLVWVGSIFIYNFYG